MPGPWLLSTEGLRLGINSSCNRAVDVFCRLVKGVVRESPRHGECGMSIPDRPDDLVGAAQVEGR